LSVNSNIFFHVGWVFIVQWMGIYCSVMAKERNSSTVSALHQDGLTKHLMFDTESSSESNRGTEGPKMRGPTGGSVGLSGYMPNQLRQSIVQQLKLRSSNSMLHTMEEPVQFCGPTSTICVIKHALKVS